MDSELNYRLLKIETILEELYDVNIVDKKKCTICKSNVRLFLPFGVNLRKNARCPVCGSLERHRTLWNVFDSSEILEKEDNKILHFAPEKVFFDKFKEQFKYYYPVDYDENYPGIVKKVDIMDISYENDYFDVIICNHVLEHIPDDIKAMSELHRVLKTKGIVFITVPLDLTSLKTLENPEYNTPELRLKYYGQEDHVRIYSLDIVEKLSSVGFNVTLERPNIYLGDNELMKYGIFKNEIIFKCVK